MRIDRDLQQMLTDAADAFRRPQRLSNSAASSRRAESDRITDERRRE
jgi:hypothetical protein